MVSMSKESKNKPSRRGGRGLVLIMIFAGAALAAYMFVLTEDPANVPGGTDFLASQLKDAANVEATSDTTTTTTKTAADERTTADGTASADSQTTTTSSESVTTNNDGTASAAAAAAQIEEDETHAVAGLSCQKYGGPPDEFAAEMVYWRDIPSDAHFESQYKTTGPEVKYLTFEPDEGGWNNIRMAMETAVTIGLAMGRILVMPPEQGMYLLGKSDKGQKDKFTFKDFFHFDSVELEHKALEVISFEEFLKREGLTGHLRDRTTGAVSFPPENRTNWDGMLRNYEAGKRGVFPWLRTVTRTVDWDWGKCIAGFPKEPGALGAEKLKAAFALAKSKITNLPWQNRVNSYNNNPTDVDAEPEARIRELISSRNDICVFDETMQQEKFVHLMGDNDSNARMLAHFYGFLFFEDWHQDLWTKRFVRDHLRYVDQIQCTAAKVVEALRQKSKSFGDENGTFYTMHIRRGDFQYKDTRVDADVIFENSRDVLPANSTLFIATDERDKSFFKIFAQHYRIYYLDSFPHLLSGVNTNFYGMLDTLIASRGKVFVGTYYSTFTGYINRLRGYHSQKDKDPGYERGEISSYYYVPVDKKLVVREYRTLQPPYWAREFPIGWRDIDHDVEA